MADDTAPKCRIYKTKSSHRWVIQKYIIGKGYRKDAEAPFILSRDNKYNHDTKPPTIQPAAIIGFADRRSVDLYCAKALRHQLHLGSEITYPDFTWEAGTRVGYTDLNFYDDEGRIWNVIPINKPKE